MPSPLPYMKVWHKEFLSSSSTRGMTLAERGLYWDLLMFQWEDGSIPDDPAEIARLVGRPPREVAKAWPRVREQFQSIEEGRVAQQRMAADREETLAKRQKLAENGRRGGRAREEGPDLFTDLQNKPKSEDGVHSKSHKTDHFEPERPSNCLAKPEPKTKKPLKGVPLPPTVQECKTYARQIGLKPEVGEKFWHYYQARGWTAGDSPLLDWRAALNLWLRRSSPDETLPPDREGPDDDRLKELTR